MRTTALAGAVLAAAAMLTSPASAQEVMHCVGHPQANLDPRAGRFVDAEFATMRTAPHATCRLVTQLRRSSTVDYFCWGPGDAVTRNGITYTTWTYLRETSTGLQGWVSDAFLALNPDGSRGSNRECPSAA